MPSSFHKSSSTTDASFMESDSALVPAAEGGSDISSPVNLPIYPFLPNPNPCLPFSSMLTWPYPLPQYDPGLWTWTAGPFHPLFGSALANYGEAPSLMMNPGRVVGQPVINPSPPPNVSTSTTTPVEARSPLPTTPEVEAVEGQQSGHEPVTFKCEWNGCTNAGTFRVKSSLLRHVDSTHISANKFKCPACTRAFGRKDKYKSHIRHVHWDMPNLIAEIARSP
ncbi:uncharacterized protein N7458_004513 [Penicillium daleae]|uniref:C2H2-type domain-containing protein n=1 Tax=Penicillium daleae TaxID=63821 RepID=A0AAD6C687_9EURO|nr:uncharacterized protein N7458_004513 [Penicillium daleae]KAJ5453557.1 hypothetical protein N7458_004513 [Penicillium daleae]